MEYQSTTKASNSKLKITLGKAISQPLAPQSSSHRRGCEDMISTRLVNFKLSKVVIDDTALLKGEKSIYLLG